MAFLTDGARWLALCERNPAAHAAFIYAVTTTRIFCRPTCSSRLARRAHVVFFDTAADASRAGFRPCKRCKPAALFPTLQERQHNTIRRACRIMRGSAGFTAPGEVARQVGWSSRYFHGLFKREMGITPAQYAKQCDPQAEDAPPGGSLPLVASAVMGSFAAELNHAEIQPDSAGRAAHLPSKGYGDCSTPHDLPENIPFMAQDTTETTKACFAHEDCVPFLDPSLCGDILSLEGVRDGSLSGGVYQGDIWPQNLPELGQLCSMEIGEAFSIEPW